MALYRRARSTRLLVISLVTASLLTITLDFRGGHSGPFDVAGKAALSVIGPLQQAVSRVFSPIVGFFSGLVHLGSMRAENRALKAQIARMRQLNSQALATQRQVLTLRKLLRLKQSLSLRGVAAQVIGESVGNFEWSITVDQGSSSGIRVDMPVVSGDGLVGHIVQVSPGWSKVQLILDPRSAVAARLDRSGETGLVVGQRNQDLKMDLVAEGTRVAANEQVLTSGYRGGALYPPGIVIGSVSSVSRDPGGLTKGIRVRPAVDFSALEFVVVVKN